MRKTILMAQLIFWGVALVMFPFLQSHYAGPHCPAPSPSSVEALFAPCQAAGQIERRAAEANSGNPVSVAGKIPTRQLTASLAVEE
jgi:hypothetical protein